jgi:predicted ATPase/DNA-binding CsgD family transcriptional regulator
MINQEEGMADGTGENFLFVGQQPTSLVGRRDEIASVKEQILRNDVRLLTLIGVAGVGKTRLAITAADEMRKDFVQITFVDLAPLNNASQVLPAIARACGVLESNIGTLQERLSQSIGARRTLLVVDNCEHVLEAMSGLSYLLSACPGLKVLATSREILRLKWEWVFPVSPLPLPDMAALPALDSLIRVPSVALFVQRAQTRKPDFALTPGNARSVAELCVRLDGLPLAIELAAAQMVLFAPKDLLESQSRRLALMTGGARDAPARHQTLRAAIDWSYDLLAPHEQSLFQRLSVFSAGWTLRTAEKICAGDGLEESEILALMRHLVDHSLVVASEQTDGAIRYRFLETLHEYARERLQETGKEAYFQRRRLDWYIAWAEENEPNMWGPGMPAWLSQLDAEFGNIQGALQWSLTHPGEAASGIRLFSAVARYVESRGVYFTYGQNIASEFLAQVPEHTTARVNTLVIAFFMARNHGDLTKARQLAEECLALSRELDDNLSAATAFTFLGSIHKIENDPQRAIALYQEGVVFARSRAEREPRVLYITLFNLGYCYCLQGDYQRAIPILEEALSTVQLQGEASFHSCILGALGLARLGLGDIEHAESLLLEALRISQELDYTEIIAQALEYLGQAAWQKGEKQKAVNILGAAAAERERSGIISWNPDLDHAKMMQELGQKAIQSAQKIARELSTEASVRWALSPEHNTGTSPATDILPVSSSPSELLSPRELEIAQAIAQGLSNRDIALKLHVSVRTVDAHVHHILNKLDLTSRSQIAVWFLSNHPH